MTLHSKTRGAQRPERWAREDEAPRLREIAPRLQHLSLELFETAGDRRVLDSARIQHIIVQRAAALFEVPCSDPGCHDGGFDVTADVLRALRHEQGQFSGEVSCFGSIGEFPCRRVLNYRGIANWSETRRELSSQ